MSAVEKVGLDNHGGPGFTVISRRSADNDVAALYFHPEMSANSYQSCSRSFRETSPDCRRASAASHSRSTVLKYCESASIIIAFFPFPQRWAVCDNRRFNSLLIRKLEVINCIC